MATDAHMPQRRPTSAEETGRTCPYCRFALKQGVEAVVCGACAAPHHADCWDDNGGCAVVACTGGPGAATGEGAQAHEPAAPTARFAAAAASPSAAQPGPADPPPPTPPPAGGGRRYGGVPVGAVALIVALLLLVGAAGAIVLTRGEEQPAQAVRTIVTVQQAPAEPAATATTAQAREPAADAAVRGAADRDEQVERSSEDSSSQPLASSSSDAQTEIEDVLYRHHRYIVDGDFSAAWDLMSARKRQQKLEEDGYAGWVTAQKSLQPYLDPSGIDVAIENIDDRTGVARVYVGGMGWSQPGSPCSEWSGITWMQFDEGRWAYDPGYSTTPERERAWKPRYGELMGGSC